MSVRSKPANFSVVIAGLDPAIHCADARDEFLQNAIATTLTIDAEPGRSVDCRVKPGNDDSFGVMSTAVLPMLPAHSGVSP